MTCGERFPFDQKTSAYADHLDGHFREEMEKRKKIQRRMWLHSRPDWTGNSADCVKNTNVDSKANKIPSVPATKGKFNNEKCPVCLEEFEQFFKDDDDDALNGQQDAGLWHLQNAIRPDGPNAMAYHPTCYPDRAKGM